MVTVGKTCPILFVPEDDDRALGHNGVAHPAGCKLDGIVAAVNFRENIGNDAFFLEDAVHNGADEVSFLTAIKGFLAILLKLMRRAPLSQKSASLKKSGAAMRGISSS